MSLLVPLEGARTVTTPNATMRTLASPTTSPQMPVAVWRTDLAAGATGPRHTIDGDQFVTVVYGSLRVEIDGTVLEVGAGDGIKLPAGSTRMVAATDAGAAVTVTVGHPDAHATVADGDPVPVPWTA